MASHSIQMDPTQWQRSDNGELVDGQLLSVGAFAHFKHSRPLLAGHVWSMQVEAEKDSARVGIAGERFDASQHLETCGSTALVYLGTGTTILGTGLSVDAKQHINANHLATNIPST
jgi:hypothetical protein